MSLERRVSMMVNSPEEHETVVEMIQKEIKRLNASILWWEHQTPPSSKEQYPFLLSAVY